MFVLQHLAHHHKRLGTPLYISLLDVKGAYDTTVHGHMVDTLLQQQFPQHLVRGVAGMYQTLQYQVLAGGISAAPFDVGIGVKQGCPLSPLLYNLYVQPLSDQLASLELGPQFPGVEGHNPDFHYADDIALLGGSPPGLQSLINATHEGLRAVDLRLSVPKCLGMVLGSSSLDSQSIVTPFCVGTETMQMANVAGERYLGLIFDSCATANVMASHRATCFQSSYYAVTSKMRAAVDFPCAIPTFLEMLHTVIEPSGLYGSELWGLLSIPGLWSLNQWSLEKFYGLADVLEVKRCVLIRKWLKLPSSAPSLPLLHELGCEPLVHTYLRRAVRFYNALVTLEDSCAYKGALRQNVQDAFAASRPAKNLVHALFQVLRILLPTERGLVARFKNGQCIDESEVESAITKRYLEHVKQLSLVQDGLGSRVGLYFRAVGLHALGTVPEYYRLPLSQGVLVRFLRFRLGCHHLRVNTGRWVQPPLPRRQRVCLRCHSACLDDEAHCLLVCSHPTIVDAREKMHAAIPVAFRHNMATYAQFWGMLGRLLSPDMVYATVKFVAVCTRVAWFSHKSGGSNAHLLPEVLVNTDTHLDLFDSESEDASDFEELIEVQANGLSPMA
jgi:hypothetical protein